MKRLSNTDQSNNELQNVPTPIRDGDAANRSFVVGLTSDKISSDTTHRLTATDTAPTDPADGDVWLKPGSSSGGAVNSVNTKTGDVVLTKADIGLGNVDNTSDANKPVSTATQAALNGKVSSTTSKNIIVSATAPTSPADGDIWIDIS